MSKEKLKANKVPATLFVGMGGIGSGIVEKVALRCHEGELDSIRFVAMDTNVNDLNTVKEGGAKVVGIQTSSAQSVLDYLKNDEEARTHWFPCNTTLYPKTVSEGAGQVRAISRLALNAMIKNGRINKLYRTIDELFLKDGEEMKQALRVVLVSSACGGTGSGITMAVGMLIRDYLHKHYREKAAIIRCYFLLPGVLDTKINTESERISLRRNGYATIKEVNAFMINASGFTGVRKELERYKNLHVNVPTTSGEIERLDNLPFDFCFLLDRIDQSQESMQTLEQYKEFAAQSLYEQNIGPMQKDAFSMEDNVIKEFANADNLGRNRFGGIGAAVLRYPYEQIADYIAFTRAISRIRDGNDGQSWLKYDNAYKTELAEFKKKRAISTSKEPLLSDVYMSQLRNDGQRFGIDIKSYLQTSSSDVATTVDEKVDLFIDAFRREILESFTNLPEVAPYEAQVGSLKAQLTYGKEGEDVSASDNLSALRTYERLVRTKAASVAEAKAKAILWNGPNIKADVKDYHIESLLRTQKGAMHPNAMRYVLYALLTKLKMNNEEVISSMKQKTDDLNLYAPNANSKIFEVGGAAAKGEETCIDDVVALEKENPSIFDKIGGISKVYDKFNKVFPGFANAVCDYRDFLIDSKAYDIAIGYVEKLNREFESFYASFTNKVITLGKKKRDIADELKFRKGDTVVYICGEKRYLDRLAEICPEGSDGLLLPDELNANIFEGIKVNAEAARMLDYDPYADMARSDIFDDILLDYFRNSVRTECKEVIDLDIIRAIAVECQFKAYFSALDEREDEEEDLANYNVSERDRNDYLVERILLGNRLASAGISFSTFAEARVVKCSTFNDELLKIKSPEVSKLLESLELSPKPSDTVSKYDLRFFNALYNITPDQLARFRAPEADKGVLNYSENAGIYYSAYHEYIKKIGPDSTKSATISLHIDKRWDSLTELPELDLKAHYLEMVRIHSALILGIVFSMIKTHPSSRYDANKRIFALEDIEGDLTTLIVSNNTECDEFYEVLDALYRDRASVTKIYDMLVERFEFDLNCNRRYKETTFFKEASSFVIGEGHDAPNSMFEIPLVYFNSLPRAKLDDNELSIMIDSVIGVISDIVSKYEKPEDVPGILTERLIAQFELLVKNFNNEEFDLQKNSDLRDNRVINMALRKVCNKIKALNTSEFEEKIAALRALVK